MKDAGYIYVNIDDTWEGRRDAKGNIRTNKKFPDMKALADYVHSKGLKIGIYSSPGPKTCAGLRRQLPARRAGCENLCRLGHRLPQVRLVQRAESIRATRDAGGLQKMGDALNARGPAHSLQPVPIRRENVWEWGAKVGGNLWRTTGDIRDTGKPWRRSASANRAGEIRRAGTLERSRTCSRWATAA